MQDLTVQWSLVGYSGDSHWISRQISYWSKHPINHVGIRFYGVTKDPVEIYYDVKRGPALVTSRAVEKFFTPVWESRQRVCFGAGYKAAKRLAFEYPVGKVIPCYTHFFVGLPMTPPPTCARMASEILTMYGYPVEETFMPGKLIQEFQDRYES